MNHLFSGTALAAALAIAAPVWAQTTAPSTPSSPATAAAVPSSPKATSTPHKRINVHRHTYHHAYHHAYDHHAYRYHAYQRVSRGDIANRLNAEELGRVGSSPAPGVAGAYGWGYGQGGGVYGQPSPTQGIPGAWQSSASPHSLSGPGPEYVPGQFQSSPSPNAPGQMR
jgi:hypothetical protein